MGPSVGVGLWSEVLGVPWDRWIPGNMPNYSDVNVAFVNIFHTPDSLHVTEIRQKYPSIKIVGMVDAPPELVMSHPEWSNIYRQLARCDAIGGRTGADCDYYGMLLHKPTFYLPSPIGPSEYFYEFREKPREPFIVTLDHSFNGNVNGPNIALVAALARHTNYPIHYVSARDWTPTYTTLAGVSPIFYGALPFTQMVELSARASLCVDLYTSHSYGRQQVVCGLIGTPILASSYCLEAPGMKIDPYNLGAGLIMSDMLLHDALTRKHEINRAYTVASEFEYPASKNRIEQVIKDLTT